MKYRHVVAAVAGSCVFWIAPVAHGQVTILQNDSFTGSAGTVTCVAGFAETETMAVRFTATAALYPYHIERIQVLACSGAAIYGVDIWQDDGPGPIPGAQLWTSGDTSYQIGGTSAFYEIVLPQPIPVFSGTVRVGLFQELALGFFPGFGRDDAITPERNYIRILNGTWRTAESEGVTGDFVLRILVRPDTLFEDGFES